jgi:hypothetical protein
MTPKGRRTILLAVAVTALPIVLSIPIAQETSGDQLVNGRPYTLESESLFGDSSWLNYSYRGVTFGFHLWCSESPGGGVVCGNSTESGGTAFSYAFFDGPPQVDPRWQTWVAADGHEAVQYRQGGLVHLLVAT